MHFCRPGVGYRCGALPIHLEHGEMKIDSWSYFLLYVSIIWNPSIPIFLSIGGTECHQNLWCEINDALGQRSKVRCLLEVDRFLIPAIPSTSSQQQQ